MNETCGRTLLFATLLALLAAGGSRADDGEDETGVSEFLNRIESDDADVRYAARFEAREIGARAVVALSKLTLDGRTEVANTARTALENLVHFAGRPGAQTEREAVAAELGRLLELQQPAGIKREALHLISFIGGDAIVPRVAKLLDDGDRHVRDAARLALERIPAPAAAQALVAAARGGKAPEAIPDLLFSLGKKADSSVVPFLSESATDESETVRFAALEALAYLGAPGAITLFEASLAQEDVPGGARLFNEYLRLADNLRAAGKGKEASGMYRRILSDAPLGHQRERALLRLAPRGSAEALDELLASLADPAERVWKLALERLAGMQGGDVYPRLQAAYQEAPAKAKPILLRGLAESNREATQAIAEDASRTSSAELKLTALDILGRLDDPDLAPLLHELARSGSSQIKPTAVKGQLLLASRQLEQALSAYRGALEFATDDNQRAEALRGLERLGDPSAIDDLVPLLKDPVLASEAATVYMTLAARITATGATVSNAKKDEAEKRLLEIVNGQFSNALKTRAVAELRKIERDPLRLARKQGFILDWWIVGPIRNRNGDALKTKYFPEEAIELAKVHRMGPRRFRWQKLPELSLDGRVDLLPRFRRSDRCVAYAHTELNSPKAQKVLFKIGSDDGVACWLNGERIHFNDVARSLRVDQDTVEAELSGGNNRILLKVNNIAGGWGFALRLTDLEGNPLELQSALD